MFEGCCENVASNKKLCEYEGMASVVTKLNREGDEHVVNSNHCCYVEVESNMVLVEGCVIFKFWIEVWFVLN